MDLMIYIYMIIYTIMIYIYIYIYRYVFWSVLPRAFVYLDKYAYIIKWLNKNIQNKLCIDNTYVPICMNTYIYI